jgi:nucleoside diphosphate kinase
MAIETTLSILKPDATRRNLTGAINALFESKGRPIPRKPHPAPSAPNSPKA